MDRNQPYIVQDKKKNHLNNQIFKILPPPRSEDKMPGWSPLRTEAASRFFKHFRYETRDSAHRPAPAAKCWF